MAQSRNVAENIVTNRMRARASTPAAVLPPFPAAEKTDRISAGRARYFKAVTYAVPMKAILWAQSGRIRPSAAPATKQSSVAHDTILSLTFIPSTPGSNFIVLYSRMGFGSS